jgi:hypothetical protein
MGRKIRFLITEEDDPFDISHQLNLDDEKDEDEEEEVYPDHDDPFFDNWYGN